MSFFRFVFYFLYTRNWYSGELELSLPRTILFAGMLFLIVLGVVIAGMLQAPVTYSV